MKAMIGPLSAATFLIPLLQYLQGATAMKDLHTCQVITPTANQDIAILKLDFTNLLSTVVPNASNNDLKSTDTTHTGYNNNQNIDPSTTVTNYGVHNNVSEVNMTTTQATEKANDATEGVHCYCQVYSTSTTTISAMKVNIETSDKLLLLLVNETESLPLYDAWNRTFEGATSVRLAVAHNVSMESYTVLLKVEGKLSNVTCTQHADVNSIGPVLHSVRSRTVFKSNEELLFEIPLLVIGSVMAVIGSAFIAIGIAAWRRYLRKFKGGSGKSSSSSSIEDEENQRKASQSPVSKRKVRQEEASPTSQECLDVVDSRGIAGDQRPSPGTARYKRISFGRRNKKQKRKKNDDKESGSNVTSVEEETYCSVLLEYEDIPPDNPQSAVKMDTRVATPLAELLKSGEQPHPLRKSHTLKQAQAKARTMPKMQVRQDDNTYSHLNRSEKSHSDNINQAATYDDPDVYSSADADVHCVSTGAAQNNVSVFNFPKPMAINKAKLVREDTGSTRSSTSNKDDQDHIYEAIDKVETQAIDRNQSSQRYQNVNKGHQKRDANFQVDGSVKGEQRGTEGRTAGASQPDTTGSTDVDRDVANDSTDGNNSDSIYNDASTHDTAESRTHSTVDDGTHGIADAGTHGTAESRTHGTAESRTHDTAESRTHDTADDGTRGTDESRTHGTADAGTHGTADAGTHGTADAGTHGTADAGTHGTADAGTHGTADAGTHGTADATQDTVGTNTKPNIEDSGVDRETLKSALNDILARNISLSNEGKHDQNLQNNPCDPQRHVMNSTQSPDSIDLDKDSISLHVLSGYRYTTEGTEVSPTSSRPDGINETEASFKDTPIDDYPEQYVIAHNILYETSSLFPRTSL